jgi:hypothetical protein
MYAKNDTTPAIQPLSFNLLSTISPIAKIKKIIPANEIYILSIEIDTISPLTKKSIALANCIISYERNSQ